MKYFLKETYAKANHAGPKARMDAEKIMLDSGYLEYFLKGSQKNNNLNQNDIIIFQFPLLWQSLKKQIRMRFLKKRNFKAYLLIHDIESLRNKKIKSFSDFKLSTYSKYFLSIPFTSSVLLLVLFPQEIIASKIKEFKIIFFI